MCRSGQRRENLLHIFIFNLDCYDYRLPRFTQYISPKIMFKIYKYNNKTICINVLKGKYKLKSGMTANNYI